MDTRYPIHDLIVSRLAQLGIRRGEFARRCGYRNLSRGLRWIDAVCAGAEPGSEMLDALAIALDIDRKAVDVAARARSEIIAEAERQAADAAWRAACPSQRQQAARTAADPSGDHCDSAVDAATDLPRDRVNTGLDA